MPADRTNMDLLPESVRELRIVQIGDRVDMCPCAGTHVTNLKELGHVNLLGKKSKGKGTQRVSYQLQASGHTRDVIDGAANSVNQCSLNRQNSRSSSTSSLTSSMASLRLSFALIGAG